MKRKHWTMIVPGAVLLCASPAYAVELRDAVQAALNTNPEIRQAVANRVATQEERVQAQGLWYPRISVEGSAGVRNLRNPTRRNIGIADETLYPIEGELIVDQLLFDSGGREAEIRRQASRTDAAAARVEERSRIRRAQRRPRPTSTICCSSGWWRSPRTMRRSTSGSPATFAKASPRARSASPTSSRPKSGCSRPAPA